MKSIEITTIGQLKSEITRLRILDGEQQTALKLRVNSPAAIFASVMTAFPKKTGPAAPGGGFFHPDILRMISRVVIPFALNKTLFRNSNFLVKALVSLVSQKAAGFVSEPAAENLLTRVKSIFNIKALKKKPKKKVVLIADQVVVVPQPVRKRDLTTSSQAPAHLKTDVL